jgi:hypothetical protein
MTGLALPDAVCDLRRGKGIIMIRLIALMMAAVQTSETSVNSYQSTRCYNPLQPSSVRLVFAPNLLSFQGQPLLACWVSIRLGCQWTGWPQTALGTFKCLPSCRTAVTIPHNIIWATDFNEQAVNKSNKFTVRVSSLHRCSETFNQDCGFADELHVSIINLVTTRRIIRVSIQSRDL